MIVGQIEVEDRVQFQKGIVLDVLQVVVAQVESFPLESNKTNLSKELIKYGNKNSQPAE